MPGRPRKPVPGALVALTLLCCAASPALAPAAARGAHEKSAAAAQGAQSAPPPGEAQPPAPATESSPAPGGASPAGAAPAATPAHQHAHAGGEAHDPAQARRAPGAEAQRAGTGAGAGAGAGAGGQASRGAGGQASTGAGAQAGGGGQRDARHDARTHRDQSGAQAAPSAATSAGASAQAQAPSADTRGGSTGEHTTRHREKEREKKEAKAAEKESRGKGGGGEAPGEGEAEEASPEAPIATPAPAPALSAAVPIAPASASSAAAAAGPAPAQPGTVTPPAVVASSASAVRTRHRPRAASGRRGRPGAAGPRAALAAALAPAALAADGAHARSQERLPGAARPRGRERVSPLARTITRIVDVVPPAVRLVIAALLALALALAARSRMAAVRARRLERQRGQLLEDVGLLQAALLPVAPAQLGEVLTSAAYEPAAGPGAGGDFYDLFALEDGRLAVIVGDVSGHGRQALPHTALVRFTLRAYLEAGLSPRDAVQTAGAVLERQLAGVFATVLAATYDPARRLLTYASAGHPPPLVLAAGGDAGSPEQVTICAAPPIGIGMRTGTRQTVLSLPGRALLCFYTDGVTEARVGSDLFGRERLVEELEALGPEAAAGELLDAVAARADARPDDMAACVLSLRGGGAVAEVRGEELELDREEAASPRTERFLRACGLSAQEAAEAMRLAAGAAGRAGTVVLELRYEQGRPMLELRRQQLAFLDPARIEAKALRGDAAAARGAAGVAR